MTNGETYITSYSKIYVQYAPALFGYILSLLKDEPQAIDVLGKTIYLLDDTINSNHHGVKNDLLDGIKIANRTMLQTTNLEKESLLNIFREVD